MNTTLSHEHTFAPGSFSHEYSAEEACANESLYDRYISRSWHIGLGRDAVTAAYHLSHEAFDSTSDVDVDRLPTREILQARQQLESLSLDQRRLFNELLETHRMPEWLNELIGADEYDIRDTDFDLDSPIVAKLIQKDAAGDYTVNDTAVLHFLQMHNFNVTQVQQEFNELLPGVKSRFLQRLTRAVTSGNIPLTVLDRYEQMQDKSLVVVDDGMETHCLGVHGRHIALDTPEVVSVIMIDPLTTGHEREGTYTHEALHGLTGRHVGKITSIESDFCDQPTRGAELINEAITEHLTQFLLGLSGKTPTEYDGEAGSYSSPRALLHKIITHGQKTIPFDMFIKAYFEDESADELRDAIVDSFDGFDIITAIAAIKTNTDITNLEGKLVMYSKTRLVRKAVRAIHKMAAHYNP